MKCSLKKEIAEISTKKPLNKSRWFSLICIVTVGLGFLLPVAQPLTQVANAAPASPPLVFYYTPTADKAVLKDFFDGKNKPNTGDYTAALDQTSILTKSLFPDNVELGVMHYDSKLTSEFGNNSGEVFYSMKYTCYATTQSAQANGTNKPSGFKIAQQSVANNIQNYSVTYAVGFKAVDPNIIDKDRSVGSVHAGFAKVTVTPNKNGGVLTDVTDSGSGPSSLVTRSSLPSACKPNQLGTKTIPNYYALSPELQAIYATQTASANTVGTNKAASAKSNATTGDDDSSLGCDLGIDGFNVGGAVNAINPLNWLFCGLVKGLVGIVDVLDKAISSQLAVGTSDDSGTPNQIFADSNGKCAKGGACDAYYAAWKSFRNIALGLMVIAGLVVLISQAMGMEILDAYTIRKVLPRLLVAAIAITLSWQLMQFFVTFTNDVGYGIRYLIYSPFDSIKAGLHVSVEQSIGLTILGGIGYLLAGFAGLMLLGATAALALFMAFLVLILRQIVIIMLIIMAPIGIVAYILPNTQRIYKLWWESFSKALLMFPLIAAFIATGRVFSAIASQQGDGLLMQMIAFIAYFAPYFMIPMTFRFAGGALSQITGAVNNRSQGAFGMLKNARNKNTQDRWNRARGPGIYRPTNRLTKGLNNFGFYTLNADEQIPYDIGAGRGIGRGSGRLGKRLFGRQTMDMAAQKGRAFAEHTAKATEHTNMHYTAAYGALGMRNRLAGGMTKGEDGGLAKMDARYGRDEDGNWSRESGKEAVRWEAPKNGDFHGLTEYAQLLSAGAEEGSAAKYGATELLEKAGELSSFGTNPEMNRATLQSVAAATAAKDGKLHAHEVAEIHNQAVADAKGDPAAEAFAAAQMTQLETLSTQQRQDLRRGKGIRVDKNGHAFSVYDKEHYQSAAALESLLTAKAGSVGAGKGEYYDETWDSYLYHGDADAMERAKRADAAEPDEKKRVHVKQVEELRKFMVQQSGIYGGGDPGAKAKVDNLKQRMGITREEEGRYMGSYREGGDATAAAEGAKQPEPPAAPGP